MPRTPGQNASTHGAKKKDGIICRPLGQSYPRKIQKLTLIPARKVRGSPGRAPEGLQATL